jgi:cytoskeletal protein CcmA (bactofilin family)
MSQNKFGTDVVLQGELSLAAPTVFEGRMEGEIHAQANFQIAAKAVIKANIHGTTVIVEGEVHGNLYATEKVELRGGAQFYGDITCGKLVMEEGVSLVGNVKIASTKAAPLAPKVETHTSAPAPTP